MARAKYPAPGIDRARVLYVILPPGYSRCCQSIPQKGMEMGFDLSKCIA